MASPSIIIPCECVYWYEYFIIVVFIIINYISVEFIFKEKRLNEYLKIAIQYELHCQLHSYVAMFL